MEDLDLQQQLSDAIQRVEALEERVSLLESASRWRHLIYRPHPWRKQLSLGDRNMTIGQMMSVIVPNRLTVEQAADDLDLPTEAIEEALAYYNENRDLVQREAEEERRHLADKGLRPLLGLFGRSVCSNEE